MGRDSADLRAKGAIAIVAGLFLVCLMGAFLFPGVPRSRWLLLGPILLGLALPVLLRMADHDRIRHAIRERRGVLLAAWRQPFWKGLGWGSEYYSTYHVLYRDAFGAAHLATCRTGMLWSVQWVDEAIYPDEATGWEAAVGRGYRGRRSG